MSDVACPSPRLVVVFRNDDLSALSDLAQERRIAEIFARYRVPQTIGVIPLCTSGDWHDRRGRGEVSIIENRPIVHFLTDYAAGSGSELALHGLTHRTNPRSRPARREYAEFRGLPLKEQEERLERALEIFARAFGRAPRSFIPPWNRLDGATLEACLRGGLSIISAGPFTPALDGLAALGTDCTLATFPARVEAVRADGCAVLRVLYHSRTIRTDDEVAGLERAVRLAAETPGCEVLTIAAVVERYPALAREANEAARNLVPQDEVLGTPRARALVYRRIAPFLPSVRRLEATYAAAASDYLAARYREAATRSPTIDRGCTRVLRAARAVIAAAACGLTFGLAAATEATRFNVYTVGLGATAAAATIAFSRGTAPDTRREVFTAGLLAIAGTLAGAALHDLLLRLAVIPGG